MDEAGKLFQVIKGGLFHITSLEGYRGIARDGAIKPNEGKFPSTYSARGVCHLINAVALLDLGLGKQPLFGPDALGLWMGLLTVHKPVMFILDLDRSRFPSGTQLLTFDDLGHYMEPPYRAQMLPDTEVCHPGPIPVRTIKRCIVVDYWDSNDFEIFAEFPVPQAALEAMLARMAAKRQR